MEKDSGVLGYPQEVSSALNADHHSVCKYKTQEDPNYVDVKNMIKWMISQLTVRGRNSSLSLGTLAVLTTLQESAHKQPGTSSLTNAKRLQDILGVEEVSDYDLSLYRGEAMDGSFRWIAKQQPFLDWIDAAERRPKIFWMTGPPATGKSTLTSFVVEYLCTGFLEHSCQFHFFVAGHQLKRTATYCLRSIAFQLALFNDSFRRSLFALNQDTGILFGSQNLSTIWEKIFEGIVFKNRFAGPLFWVVDALDEAENPQVLLNLFMKIRSLTPIRIFMTSRMTKELSILTASHAKFISHERLSINDTVEDIRAYVHNVVHSALPYDTQFQEDIVREILNKASGSFLWVKLALNTLKDNWHTREDVRKALHDVPSGMESLYESMISHVMNQNPRPRSMALRMLTWTACASRPLRLDELRVALSPEFDGFVSLEDTIIQICGHFVKIDKSRVLLIHATARQFLLGETEDRYPYIDRREGHEHLALRCIEFLSDDRWKGIFMRTSEATVGAGVTGKNRLSCFDEDFSFISYAVQNWAFHVSNSKLSSEKLLPSIEKFFDKYCLTWIHAVALAGDLRKITHAAQDLKAYVRKRGQKNSLVVSSSKNIGDQASKFIRLWAVDLIRIVGKFGSSLAENPSSIYRMIPPFCPTGSRIRETYGRTRDNALSVAGISSSDWDDCLARLSVGDDETASRVLCTGSYFVTLVSSSGTLVVWHAETCNEARRMKHGEYVTMMAANKSGTMIATAGVRTFRVWEITTGRQLHCIRKDSQARTMAIAFGAMDSELLVGRDDFSISCWDLGSDQELWNFLAQEPDDVEHTCPRLMKFSPDITKVAVACRGKPVLVWNMTLTGYQQPRKCIRSEDRNKEHGDAWNAPELVSWQPEGTSLLILYQDTTVVDWRIVDDEQDEYDHLGAREMTISQDGNLLLTSDHNGSLSVWTWPRLNLLYRLHYDEFVRDLTFSPSGQRFYDTRGSLCNVWEPDALVRPENLDHEDTSSSVEGSIVSEPVVSHDDTSRNQITALACDANDKYYCCGKDDGSVSIFEMAEGTRVRKVYGHATTVSVISLAWSLSGKYMVSADDSGRVIAKRLESKQLGKWAVYPIFDVRIAEPVEQFIFHPSEKFLLISTATGDRIWNLKTKEELCRRRWSSRTGRRWITHPLDDKILLWIDPIKVQRYDWQSLSCLEKEEKPSRSPPSPTSSTSKSRKTAEKAPEKAERPPPVPLPNTSSRPSEAQENVNWISRTRNRCYVICETLPDTGHSRASSSRGMRVELLPSSELRSKDLGAIQRQSLDQLSKLVARLIGSFQDRVAFLDRHYWLCTWEIDTDISTYKRHFFLPKDWLSPSTLQLAVLSLHGTFLCPKNGEVGIVRHGVKL